MTYLRDDMLAWWPTCVTTYLRDDLLAWWPTCVITYLRDDLNAWWLQVGKNNIMLYDNCRKDAGNRRKWKKWWKNSPPTPRMSRDYKCTWNLARLIYFSYLLIWARGFDSHMNMKKKFYAVLSVRHFHIRKGGRTITYIYKIDRNWISWVLEKTASSSAQPITWSLILQSANCTKYELATIRWKKAI